MEILVDVENVGKRLDVFLSEQIEGYTRSYIKKLIDEEKITLNNKYVKAGTILKEKDNIYIQ